VDGGAGPARAPLWDLPTRLFHWSLVLLIAGAWWTQEQADDSELHARIGYAVLTLVIWRLLWGLFGSDTSRFSSFVRSPRAALAYARSLFGSVAFPHLPGHNPLGGYSVLLLLGSLAVQAVTGLFLYDDELFWAPLNGLVSEDTADLLEEVHELNFYVILGLVAVHVAAIAFYAFVKRQSLVRPMIVGTAELPGGVAAPRMASSLLALALLIVAGGVVYGVTLLA
jgi:cytochrome b